jgi:DNA modification methylase
MKKTKMHELSLGNALELLKGIPDKSIDLIITDPPYKLDLGKGSGSGFFGKRKYFKRIRNEVGSIDITPYLDIFKQKLKIFNAYFWCSSKQIETYLNFAIKNAYFYDILIWNKLNPIPTINNKYAPDIEYCIFIRESGATFNGGLPFDTYRKVIKTKTNKSHFGHPTEKPLKVIEPSILISSKKNDIILDPFMGSGTTGVLALKHERQFIGFEISPNFFKIAQSRIINQRQL